MIKYLQEIKSRFCLFQVPYINEILAELENIASRATFLDIQQYLQPNYPHEFDSILTAIYNPYGFDATLILDGRHRYMETLLFHPSDTLPVITLNTDDIMSAIVDTKSLLNYIIMRNIKTMNDCAMFRKPLSGLLSLSDYGFCL